MYENLVYLFCIKKKIYINNVAVPNLKLFLFKKMGAN